MPHITEPLGDIPMATPYTLFSNYTMTSTVTDAGRLISFAQDWLGILVNITAVSGAGASADFRVQWSDDGTTWWEPATPDRVFTCTAPGGFVSKFPLRAPFWRLGAEITGTTPSFTGSAAALV